MKIRGVDKAATRVRVVGFFFSKDPKASLNENSLTRNSSSFFTSFLIYPSGGRARKNFRVDFENQTKGVGQ